MGGRGGRGGGRGEGGGKGGKERREGGREGIGEGEGGMGREGKIDRGGGRESDGERCICTPTAVAPVLFLDVVSIVELSPDHGVSTGLAQWSVWVLLQHRSPEDQATRLVVQPTERGAAWVCSHETLEHGSPLCLTIYCECVFVCVCERDVPGVKPWFPNRKPVEGYGAWPLWTTPPQYCRQTGTETSGDEVEGKPRRTRSTKHTRHGKPRNTLPIACITVLKRDRSSSAGEGGREGGEEEGEEEGEEGGEEHKKAGSDHPRLRP